MPHSVFLLLGSNLGSREDILKSAMSIISKRIGEVITYSSIYETLAWGVKDQPSFLNQVLLVSTLYTPHKLLVNLNIIEKELGRTRKKKWDKRIIDIDILYYNSSIIGSNQLVVPHLEIINRRFTLVPLVEIAPEFVHPILKKTQKKLLAECKDKLEVKKY